MQEFKSKTEEVSLSKANELKKNREQAKQIRDASLGQVDRAELAMAVAEEPKSKKKKKVESSSPEKLNIGTLMDLAVSHMERMDSSDKAIHANERLKLQKEKLELEKMRFEPDMEERRQWMVLENERTNQQQKMQEGMLSLMARMLPPK